jgi:hypothetical protein
MSRLPDQGEICVYLGLALNQANPEAFCGGVFVLATAQCQRADAGGVCDRFRIVWCVMGCVLSWVRRRGESEHPDSDIGKRASAVQAVDEAEEHARPRIPAQQAIDQLPAGVHDLTWQPHEGIQESLEFHP